MNIFQWPRGHVVLVGCASAAAACAVVVGGLAFARPRQNSGAGAAAEAADKTEYLTCIAVVEPSKKAAAKGKVCKQAVEAVQRPVTLRLTGSLAADDKSDVGSNASGIVMETRIERGSVVKKGDLLVQLDPRDSQYALDEAILAAEQLRVRLGLEEGKNFRADEVPEVQVAKLALLLAEKNHQRADSLRTQNAIAISDADQMDTEYRLALQRYQLALMQARQLYQGYRAAQAHVITLQKGVEDCSIRAPFDGWIAERDVSVGERVISLFPSGKLATVLRIDPLRLSLTVPQQELARIKTGETVIFQTDAFPGKTFTGTVRYITPLVASENRSLCVEALVPNPGAVLRPGLFVTAELQLDARQTELYVPASAVSSRGDVAAVFVVHDGVIREQIVSVGEASAGRVHVTSGLSAGDVVILTPELVRDGDAS
jgi:membrane fusion protein (multidrug efflux system)